MAKEVVLNHEDIKNSQTITEVTVKAFKEKGLNIHVNEVVSLQDDEKQKKRILMVKNTKFFSVGDIPWKK